MKNVIFNYVNGKWYIYIYITAWVVEEMYEYQQGVLA